MNESPTLAKNIEHVFVPKSLNGGILTSVVFLYQPCLLQSLLSKNILRYSQAKNFIFVGTTILDYTIDISILLPPSRPVHFRCGISPRLSELGNNFRIEAHGVPLSTEDSSCKGHKLELGSLHDRGCSEWHRRWRRSARNFAVSIPGRAT